MSWVGRYLVACVVALGASGAAFGDEARLVLRGYDPVAYFTEGMARPGDAAYEVLFDHGRYRFASAAHMTLFEGDPDAYLPQFAGACAAGVSDGMKVEADPEKWHIVDGKLFVFSELPEDDLQTYIARAEANWHDVADLPFEPQ